MAAFVSSTPEGGSSAVTPASPLESLADGGGAVSPIPAAPDSKREKTPSDDFSHVTGDESNAPAAGTRGDGEETDDDITTVADDEVQSVCVDVINHTRLQKPIWLLDLNTQ